MTTLSRYELHVERSPKRAAIRLDQARRRLVELEAGAASRGTDDTVDARREEIEGLTSALAAKDIVICDDCHEPLTTKLSRERKVGPKCWAKRQRARKGTTS